MDIQGSNHPASRKGSGCGTASGGLYTDRHTRSRPIRLVRVVDRLNVGGPTHHVVLLARGLEARGYATLLVKGQVAPGEAEMEDVVLQTGVTPLEVRGLGRAISPVQDLRVFRSLRRLMRGMRPHVVHTHKSKAGVLGRLAARTTGVPVAVHTFHGHPFRGYFSPWKSGLIQIVERLLARCTDAVVAVSRQQRQDLLGYRITSPDRLHAIPLGLDLGPYVAARRCDGGLRAELGFPPSARLVGTVTRLVPIKGVDVFLRAAARVVEGVPEARFVVVGDGELRRVLEDLARQLGLGSRVRFVGFRRDTVRICSALDLAVLSSHSEGLPVALIEAIAAGCYVVATRVGGVPDLVSTERVGLTVEPGNGDALADAVVRVLAENRVVPPEERKRAGALYGIHRLERDLDCLYRRLLQEKENRHIGGGRVASCREGMRA
jgi:glycosyltransferase involved in cell wall biosynthesis